MATPVFRNFALGLVAFSLLSCPSPSVLCQRAFAAASPSSSNSSFKFVKADEKSGLKEYHLNSNGMKVLLQEKHNAPVVTVMVVYHVGSRNEAVGYTGSTHFLEHMMFKGTTNHDPLKGTGIDDILKPTGGMNNATTWFDRTNYFEVVPSKSLAACLELEADRMRHALLRSSDRQSEMTVVRNELERGENRAEEILENQLFATAFREHPYHHPTIGWRSDVEGVPIERLRQFYNDFYYPNNATLVVVGDFQTPATLDLINKYFSKVPASPKPFPKVYTVEPPQEGERRFVVQRGDELPKLTMGFHIPNATNKDGYPLEVLASILGDEKRQSSRLYKRLVDSGLASQAHGFNYSMKDPGLFTVSASANSGVKLETIEKAIEDELAELGKTPVSESELDRAKKAIWKKLRLECDDPMNFAQMLADAEAVADWTWLLNMEKNIKAVTAQDVQRVAKKYFSQSNRSVGFYLPKDKGTEKEASTTSGQSELLEAPITKVDNKNSAYEQTSQDNKACTASGTIPISEKLNTVENALIASKHISTPVTGSGAASSGKALIAERVKHKVLPNGAEVYVMPIRGTGIVAVAGKLKGGESLAQEDKTLLPALLDEMLNKGSKNISKEQLADTLETMGSSFSPEAETFWTNFDSEVVTEDLDKYLSVVSESLHEPLLKTDELDKLKKQTESELKDAMVNTAQLAQNKLSGALYKSGCVYYSRPFEQQLEELSKITSDDLKEFHKKHFVANNLVLALVGDLSPEQGFQMAEKYFGNWEKRQQSDMSTKICQCDDKPKPKEIVCQLPDKSSVDILMGNPANVSIRSKDFCAAQLANAALGHDTIASRLAEVREKHGLTYGIHSSFQENAEPWSPWAVTLSVNPENTQKALTLVKGIISNYLAKGITPAELAMEKQRLAGEFVVHRMATSAELAEALTKYGAIGVGPEFMDKYPGMLSAVTLKEANDAIKKYMKLENLQTVLAGTVSGEKKK